MEVTAKSGQEQMRAEIKSGLKEIKATKLEANQERIKAVPEHCERAPGVKAMQVITTLQSRISDVVRGVPKGLLTRPQCSNGTRDRGIKSSYI
jgi:hypothetical protein